MGLDNGIIVKHINFAEDIPDYINNKFYESDDFEFGYWRKCWGFRNEVIRKLHLPGDGGDFNIDIEDLRAIINIIKYNMRPENFEDADTIWDFDEYIDIMIRNFINLSWLLRYWETHKELKVVFYDSY